MKTADQIRTDFIEFFKNKGHTEVLASPVIPFDDPTLLFTVAGMTQFKDIFLGTGKREYSRAVDSQKCIRAGGKHNDLDEVGKDSHHHSFFEMLGNWSFGDYYKKEAIAWAWELLTEVWKLPKERLYASVYTTDDEAEEIWRTVTDIDHSHISRHGDKDNFWSMGDVGPCGPCSEIHYDRGEEFCNKKDIPGHICEVNGDCDRIMEIWNLVFIQYNKDKDGKLHELPSKHVDTGMGFERICMILQNQDSNYHIDIFMKIIKAIEKITGTDYHKDDRGIPHRVIADHIRTLLFAISDGGLPSNEGRGYVLRRILRRASRFGTRLGMKEPFIYKVVPVVVEEMSHVFPEIKKYEKHAQNIIKAEENSFLKTLSKGIELFEDVVELCRKEDRTIIDGVAVFKLYDTFGFPVDLTAQMAEEIGFSVDFEGFEKEMKKQKDLSRKNKKFVVENKFDWIELNDAALTTFVGYQDLNGQSKIIKYYVDEKKSILKLVPDQSFFYAESGGQIGDRGFVKLKNEKLSVLDVEKDGEYFVIHVKFDSDKFMPRLLPDENSVLEQIVDRKFRNNCRIHHSATHLLQAAMKKVLGNHVAQSGSYVDNQLLRFDYSHYEKLTVDQIADVEDFVNKFIRMNLKITTEIVAIEEAKKRDVTALFGEKYGNVVRIVSMGDVSAELCGGTHAERTGDIGYFKLIEETSVAAGVRRIVAVCGEKAVELSREQQNLIGSMRESLVCKEEQVLERFEKLQTEKKELEKKIAALNEKLALSNLDKLLTEKREIKGISVVTAIVAVSDNKALKSMGEHLRNKLKSGIGLLGADLGGKVGLVCVVTDDLKNTYKAGTIISTAAKIVKGGGGGAPHIATAGGKDVSKLKEVMTCLEDLL